MKILLITVLMFISGSSHVQPPGSLTEEMLVKSNTDYYTDSALLPGARRNVKGLDRSSKPEILTNGFIDIINSGQINASARFIRLYIGERGKIAVPLSIYSGVSANNFQTRTDYNNPASNESLITNFINPLGGLVNFSIEGTLLLDRSGITMCGLLYHTGERILTGYKMTSITDPFAGTAINFFSSFACIGLYFQTAAWQKNNPGNPGLTWFAARYLLCHTSPYQLKRFLPGIQTNGIYNGYSLAWGLEINSLINLKILYYKYLKKPEIEYSLPIYQFSFNYSL